MNSAIDDLVVSHKKITFISEGILTPATRFRVDPVFDTLKDRGWRGSSLYGYGTADQKLSNQWIRKAYRISCRIKRACRTTLMKAEGGPVFMQRLAIPTWGYPESRLAIRNGRFVFDFDDAIFLNSKQQECRRRQRALDQVFRSSAHVVAGNSWLAQHVPDSCSVAVIPTCLDTHKYVPKNNGSNQKKTVRIGWMGTSSNFRFIAQLAEPLRKLRTKFDFEFVICGDEQDRQLFADLGASFVKWSAENEVATLQSFDIGLMPLLDEDWCRGKCSFKLIQYMAVGIPTVSTPVGMNCDVVTEGVDGLFANGSDWASPLESLLADAALRQRMGEAARKTAQSRFALPVAVDAYEKIFLSLI